MAQWLTNSTRNHEVAGSIPALLSGLRIRRCHELCVGRRSVLDPALLWLWYRLAATVPIGPLAWEPSHLAPQKDKKKERKKESRS